MKLVILCDDYWHPGQVIEEGFSFIREKIDADMSVIYDAREFDPAILDTTDVFVFAKSDNTTQSNTSPWMNDGVIAAFERYVANGGGFIGLHSGTCYNKFPRIKAFLGGAFLFHPEQCPVRFDAIAKHPITAGVEPFLAKDEHYQMDTLEGIAILGATSSEHNAQAGAWVKELGLGKIAVITPGHNIEMFQQPGMQTLLINAVNFVKRAAV